MKRSVDMSLEKETKGSVRYAEVGEKDQMLVTLYVRKTALDAPYPKNIRVTVESMEE